MQRNTPTARYTSKPFLTPLLIGLVIGVIISQIPIPPRFPDTPNPTHLSQILFTGVSHNPEISKQVLASYFQMPHITQIARSSLKKGQVAAENWHKDMVEMFIFVEGNGILKLNDKNFSVKAGSISIIYPKTRHTIYNTGQKYLSLYTIASVP